MFRRKGIDNRIIQFKPLAWKNFILGNKKLANMIAKPLPLIFMKSQSEKGTRKEENMEKNI